MFRVLKPHQYVADGALALVYLAVGLGFIDMEFFASATSGSVVIAGYALALALRRVSPALSLILVWVFSITQMIVGLYPNLYNVATIIVVYTTAAHGGRVVRWAGLISVGLGALVAASYLTVLGSGQGVSETLFGWSTLPGMISQFFLLFGALLAVLGPPWLLGLLVRAITTTRENRIARGNAERVVAVEQERNRIARDMHDVVAHSLAVVIAQADGARYVRESDPHAVDEALTAISTTAREALGDVRQLLAQLRHNDGDGPQPTLADLDHLREQFHSSGLVIRSVERGTPGRLAAGSQLAAYRIVQEALTNALRHGNPDSPVELIVAWRQDALELVITNTRRHDDPGTEKTGHGIVGMIERATLVGGSVAAHAVDDSFVVVASIPIRRNDLGGSPL